MTRKEWLLAAIFTLVTVIVWVISDAFHARAKVEIPPKVQEIIEPISPDFDLKALEP